MPRSPRRNWQSPTPMQATSRGTFAQSKYSLTKRWSATDVPRKSLGSFTIWDTGYCTYDFFEQCPHRMACAKCDFYMPKESSSALLLEGKRHLLRLLQEIPQGESEQVAVEEGITAYESLLAKLADVPSPSGKTPRQIGGGLVPITSLRPDPT
jgi:hypothetical protein